MTEAKKAIKEVSTRILEDWGMMMVEPGSPEIGAFEQENPMLITSIEFKGVVGGKYTILCQQSFAEALSHNVLGSDKEIATEDIEDALRELANILCGNMLTECYGSDVVFDLGRPELHHSEVKDISDQFNDRTVSFLADDCPVAFTFSLNS